MVILEPVCTHHGIALAWDHFSPLPCIRGDKRSIVQVMLNLVRNSVRALAGTMNPQVTIRTRCHSGTVAVWVMDSGPGVDNPELLFKPYTAGASGSGLGLFISKALANGWGGDLRYEPLPGAGAAFRIDFQKADTADVSL
jgi:C4-dicarboxylate-specific signal transduction histidine kinase